MGTESEIYRTANLLIQKYGEMAPPAAGDVAFDLLSEKRPANVSIH